MFPQPWLPTKKFPPSFGQYELQVHGEGGDLPVAQTCRETSLRKTVDRRLLMHPQRLIPLVIFSATPRLPSPGLETTSSSPKHLLASTYPTRPQTLSAFRR